MKKISQKLKYYQIFSALSILLGAALMIYMIKFENEPGALPLFLILMGIIGFIVVNIKNKP